MEPRSRRLLASLFGDATRREGGGESWADALSDARVLRRRLVLAEILARPLAEREDARDLRARVESPG